MILIFWRESLACYYFAKTMFNNILDLYDARYVLRGQSEPHSNILHTVKISIAACSLVFSVCQISFFVNCNWCRVQVAGPMQRPYTIAVCVVKRDMRYEKFMGKPWDKKGQ